MLRKAASMSHKFFYVYLIGATVALLWSLYQVITMWHTISAQAAFAYFIPALVLYYLAYKVYHVKSDSELM